MTRKSKKIKIGNTFIGGDSPILVQSMLNVPAEDIEGSVKQAVELEKAGCQVIRFAIPNKDALALVEPIKNAVSVPLVADIHFDYKLALGAAERGIDKIRINPGNIGSEDRVKAVADICNQKGLPIRIGVNSGSLEKHILAKYGAPTPEAMVESAMYHASLLEKFDFDNIELRQIGVRDEAKMLGGLGICGRPFCCSTFLNDFHSVSIKMAKEQGLSLSPGKISGTCGRLMCCLKYEQNSYEYLNKITPRKGTVVDTKEGRGVVVDSAVLTGKLKVALDSMPDGAPIVVDRAAVRIVKKGN